MFEYKSSQQHSTVIDGKETTKINTVAISGKKGMKTMTVITAGKKPRTKTMRLTAHEIDCIRRCKFIPGLFKDCESCINKRAVTRRRRVR